jgi:hypothetical protein
MRLWVPVLAMTDWIFQYSGKGSRHDLEAALAVSPLRSWRTPRYRDRTAAGDRVWVQVVGKDAPGIYFLATVLGPTYEDPEWQVDDSPYARWRTDIRVDHRLDPPLLRVELRAAPELSSFWPFRGFQGSTMPVPADVAAALLERAESRLSVL